MDVVELARTGPGHDVRGRVLPEAGGVLLDLVVDGATVLASTPWAPDVLDHVAPATDESTWVGRWRGGWQVCLPTAGQPQPGADPPQAFHGTASQTPWRVLNRSAGAVELAWSDNDLAAVRTWELTSDGAQVRCTLQHTGDRPREVVVAEHLVLGADALAPVTDGGQTLDLRVPDGTALVDLAYDGFPTGRRTVWPGEACDAWGRVSAATPARVAALADVRPARVRVEVATMTVEVTWDGLPHALLWQELARSTEPPWCGTVVALGIEPTTSPHGAGTAAGDAVLLRPGATLGWAVALRVSRHDGDDR